MNWDKFDARSFIAIFVTVAVVLLAFVLVFTPVADSNDVAKMLIGGLMTVGFATIVNFFFGSSHSSQAKDDTIAKMSGAGPPPSPPPGG